MCNAGEWRSNWRSDCSDCTCVVSGLTRGRGGGTCCLFLATAVPLLTPLLRSVLRWVLRSRKRMVCFFGYFNVLLPNAQTINWRHNTEHSKRSSVGVSASYYRTRAQAETQWRLFQTMEWESRISRYQVLLITHLFSHTRWQKWPLTLKHVPVGIVSNGVDVWGHLCPSPSLIHVHHLGRVDGEPPVRVHCHAEEPGVGLETNSNMRRQAEFDHLGQYY